MYTINSCLMAIAVNCETPIMEYFTDISSRHFGRSHSWLWTHIPAPDASLLVSYSCSGLARLRSLRFGSQDNRICVESKETDDA